MNRKSFVLPVVVVLFVAILALTKCDGPASRNTRQDTTTTQPNAPAPDNNSANNPSSADTAFQKDSLRKKRDSVH
ncbi:MAG TPA: hypothetical protein VHD83_06850 [Puia sp.]|nr:hypothetical protein [Puia sp.]